MLITDRDGTINNYCSRYNSSAQSLYNAVLITQIAHHLKPAIVITSAPLRDMGILDLSIVPNDVLVFAGSKGREFMDPEKGLITQPISDHQVRLLNQVDEGIAQLLADPEHRIFQWIGSGYQRKFGQRTIARQNVQQNIPEATSRAWLKTIRDLIKAIDPSGTDLCIEDTGLDVEIILTHVSADDSRQISDFDKGHGLEFILKSLSLNLTEHRPLICGDTRSDLALERPPSQSGTPYASIFVTQEPDFISILHKTSPSPLILPSPDSLVALLTSYIQAS
jgi:hypothetical protein